MIIDSETNLLYLSEVLRSRNKFFDNLISLLIKEKLKYKLLPETNDIWAVDYMPIQIELNKFVQFKYEPDYLQIGESILTQTDPALVYKAIGVEVITSDIKADGGNVIRGANWVILTDKIFAENRFWKKDDVINELERLFEVRAIIIPREPNDYIGHADGILRYYDNDTVLMNRYKSGDKEDFKKRLVSELKNQGIRTIEISYNPYENANYDMADGLYINYLQMANFILLPTFEKKEDEIALREFEQLFPAQTVETIDSREISKDGGVLNCITWNIKSVKSALRT